MQLQKFDISKIRQRNGVVEVIGKTGKSLLINDLLAKNQEIPVGTMISAAPFYSQETTFVVLDGCLPDNSWLKSESVQYLFQHARSDRVLCIVTMPYAMSISPIWRSNVDFVFILPESAVVANQKRIFDSYGGMFPSFDLFSQVLKQCTHNDECLVIDNTARGSNLEDMVQWYKAV